MILLFLAQIGLVISSIFIVILNFYIQPNNNFLGLNVCIAIISVAYILYFIWKNFSEVLKGWDIKLVYGALSLIFLALYTTNFTEPLSYQGSAF
ncbi:hypothetical protein DIQ22_13340, partial [Acinetobacter baumannii]|nr:hypothetical protein [Acinetobacter baumannii]MUP76275.1 hypothetical protein [Acinetobacter baumannii]MUP97176.1 hypothetical protein [Acinetobacter baumannii]MUQ40557.1 hypothetical protein [Acinetobacter baumannii]MUQ52047.1 hypothetical protein [Acinetobacter baumannii]